MSLSKKSRRDNKDVTVVVGDKEFQEDSRQLCYISEYFDGAIHSGMEESTTKRFTFPDDDPAEWELLKAAFKPGSTAVTMENVVTVLHWCDKLCVKEDLSFFHQLFWDKITKLLSIEMSMPEFQEELENLGMKPFKIEKSVVRLRDAYITEKKKIDIPPLLEALEVSIRFHLDLHIQLIDNALDMVPSLFDSSSIMKLFQIFQDYENFQSKTWDRIKELVPVELQEESRSELLGNNMFLQMLLQKINDYFKIDCAVVAGAGNDVFNGVYNIDRIYNGRCSFIKPCIHEGEKALAMIYYYGDSNWFITISSWDSEYDRSWKSCHYWNDKGGAFWIPNSSGWKNYFNRGSPPTITLNFKD